MIEIVLPVLQRFLLQGGTVLLVGVTTWLVAMPRALREGYAKAGRSAEGTNASREIGGRAHRMAFRLALILLVAWGMRLPAQMIGFRDPFVPLSDDLSLLLLETLWGAVWIGQGIVLLLLLGALVAANILRNDPDRGSATPAAVHLSSDGPAGVMPLVVATALVVLSLSLSSHALAAEGSPAIAVAADMLHTVAAGMWIGLLAVVLLLGRSRVEPSGDAFILQLRGFSVLALAAVPLLILAGVILGQYHLLTWSDLWRTTYGRILSLKIALAGLAMLLGLVNWRAGIPRLEDAGIRDAVRRRASLEVSLAIGVIILTAILTGTARPTDAM